MEDVVAADTAIQFDGDTMRIIFDSFDAGPTYTQLFKGCKRLPEYKIELRDEDALTYEITAPARFAPMLGIPVPPHVSPGMPMPDWFYDDQCEIVDMAIAAKRLACWSDCGLGKTFIEAEFARQVVARTGGRVLIVTLNEIVPQWMEMVREKYGDTLPIVRLETRAQMKRWCETGEVDDLHSDGDGDRGRVEDDARGVQGEGAGDDSLRRRDDDKATKKRRRGSVRGDAQVERQGPDGHRGGRASIAITNYEKFNHDGPDDQVVNELRHLAGFVLDESSRLKAGGGKQKWAVIKSGRGIQYKLSCTATPAPNELIEFASQASFLEKMRSESVAGALEQIIWTYFTRDPVTHRWTVKQHARAAFFEWMSSWSIYVRDPRKYGWRKNWTPPPDPVQLVHVIESTPEQREFIIEFNALAPPPAGDESGTPSMFVERVNATTSSKLSQAAKGFVYRNAGGKRSVVDVPSLKPAFIADLIAKEIAAGLQVLVWTVFDEETAIIDRLLRSHPKLKKSYLRDIDILTGSTPQGDRLGILEGFRHGKSRCLISRADMLGYGMNFQCCGSMIFSGWSFSYEQFYQAIRRAVRDGQTKSVRVHIPVITELEGQMFDAICRKEAQHRAAIEEMEQMYVTARRQLVEAAA